MTYFDINVIDAAAIKSRTKEDVIARYEEIYQHLKEGGIQPVLHKLDNEASAQMIEVIKEKKMKYQLVPPADHRPNPAERAIQTFKNHFTSILYGTDDDFPANQWDRLIRIAVIALNMLRPSRINPKLSA